MSDKLWATYEEEFWIWLDAEIEAAETKLSDLKRIKSENQISFVPDLLNKIRNEIIKEDKHASNKT